MAINYINTGSSANKGDGDTLRTAFNKINANFSSLAQEIGSTSSFVLPTASTSTLGGIKVGANLTISNGVLSASPTAQFSGTVAVLTATNSINLNGIVLSNTSGTLSAITITGTIAPDYVELLLHGDNFLDDSNYDVAILDNGVAISTSTTKYGAGSFYFDGASYISLPGSASNPAFDQAGDITIEFWSYVSAFNIGTIIASESISGNHWAIENAGGRFYFQCNDGVNSFEIVPTSFFITNQWTHCAVVKAGSVVSLYQGGTLIGNVNIGASTAFNDTIYDISIGSITDGTQGFFQGYLDEIRISRGIALYTGSFAPPAAAFPGDTFLIASALPPSGSNFTVTNISYFTNDKNYITATDVTSLGYVTATYVTSRGYLTSSTVNQYVSIWQLTSGSAAVSLASNGYITLANGAQIYDYGSTSSNGYGITDVLGGTYIGYDPDDTLGALHMDVYNGKNIRIRTTPEGTTNYKDWLFSSAGTLTAPGHILPNADLAYDLGSTSSQWRSLYVGTSTIYLGGTALSVAGNTLTINGSSISANGGGFASTSTLVNGTSTFSLNTSGSLTLPLGGVISEGNGLTGAIKLTPAGGANANQALLIYPTAGAEGDHIHLTAGGGSTDLYLGNDAQFVKVDHNGTVVVQTYSTATNNTWTFDTDGSLASNEFKIKTSNGIPTSITGQTNDNQFWDYNYGTGLATTGGSGTGLTVDVSDASNGYAGIVIDTPGTGYTAGDIITVTNGPFNGAPYASTVTFTIGISGTNSWTFDRDGDLTLPGKIHRDNTLLLTSYGVSTTNTSAITLLGEAGSLLLRTFDGTTLNTWTLDNTGTLTLPNGTTIDDKEGNLIKGPVLNSFGSDSYTGIFTTLDYTGLDTTWVVNGPGVVNGVIQSIDAVGKTIILDRNSGGPQFQDGESYTFTGPSLSIGSKITVNSNEWIFGTNGSLTLPSGGKLGDPYGDGAVNLSGNENLYAALASYDNNSWAGVTDAGYQDGAGISLGGGFFVQTNINGTGTVYTWGFNPDGRLTFPDGTTSTGAIIRAAQGSSYIIQTLGPANASPSNVLSTFEFGVDGTLTLPGNIRASGDLSITVPSGIPNGVANWIGQGGWNQGSYINTATTGGSGTGLTVDVAAGGGGYINISQITINNPGTGYTDGDVITINNENDLPGTFTITVPAPTWEFGANGGLTFPDGTTSTGAIVSANSSSYQIKTNYEIMNNPYTATFEFNGASLVLPGNGYIQNAGGNWGLDTINQHFRFPNNSKIHFGISPNLGVTADDLCVEAINTGSVRIKAGSGTADWIFSSTGTITFPDATVQTTAFTGGGIVANTGTTSTFVISNTSTSNSTNTGALRVAGGVGIGGDVNVGGIVTADVVTATQITQTSNKIRIGSDDAGVGQAFGGIAIGGGAGVGQGTNSVAIGYSAAYISQGQSAVAIGNSAGGGGGAGQDEYSIAIGKDSAGLARQGTYSTAIGPLAGFGFSAALGAYSLALGYNAGYHRQTTGSIVLSAGETTFVGTATNQGLYISPIRSATTTTGVLQYNPTTYEVTYSTTITALASTATVNSTAASVGYMGLPQNSTGTTTLTISDAGKHIYITTSSQTITIPADSSVPYPIGTTITFIAGPSATTATIAITSDTMRLAGAGTTGSRTLAAHGMASAVKVAATLWYINGTGLT